jgi:phage tail-like protein
MPGGASGQQPGDALAVARISLTIDGIEIAQFSEIAISSEVEPVELVERSGDKFLVRRLPGKRKPPTVTLKRGKNKDMGIFAWHQAAAGGQSAAASKNCTLTMFDAAGNAVARYHLENAWPSKLEIGGLKAGASEVLYETVILMCDDLSRISP